MTVSSGVNEKGWSSEGRVKPGGGQVGVQAQSVLPVTAQVLWSTGRHQSSGVVQTGQVVQSSGEHQARGPGQSGY